jgi:hypothetical protein
MGEQYKKECDGATEQKPFSPAVVHRTGFPQLSGSQVIIMCCAAVSE